MARGGGEVEVKEESSNHTDQLDFVLPYRRNAEHVVHVGSGAPVGLVPAPAFCLPQTPVQLVALGTFDNHSPVT
ncbi:hypothetical protein CLCR_00538 [Cladophialophora carrionii]|uniref:Uncharacterized protein n=1 Tax=Cladophialophora carrionii TaxID=86049 RepID=A0A1C1CBS5_9EURO|nr:hypothetical protein CLCR_00538 [Cladophialophora carrionii]